MRGCAPARTRPAAARPEPLYAGFPEPGTLGCCTTAGQSRLPGRRPRRWLRLLRWIPTAAKPRGESRGALGLLSCRREEGALVPGMGASAVLEQRWLSLKGS